MKHGEDGGSEQPGSLNIGQSLALRKMFEKGPIEPMVLNNFLQEMKPLITSVVQEVIEPFVEVVIHKVVQEEIQKFEEKLLNGGTRNDLLKERSLKMKFLADISDTVQTHRELQGIKGDCLKVALVDAASGQIVQCGPESSAKVEIVLLDDNGDDENNMTHENFERRIIRAGDKEKPHFTKSVYIYLDKGVGSLSDVKLGQDSDWTKNYNCRLGARIVQIFRGIVVQEAWTAPFKVQDNRKEYCKKHHPPYLKSEVWRLEEIGRNGNPWKRLKEKNIETLQDFLFWFHVNPEGLKKDRAHELLRSVLEPSAFEQRYKTSFKDEASLLQQFPSRSSDIYASSNSLSQHLLNGNNLTYSEKTNGYQPGWSSPSIIPTAICGPFDSLGSSPFPDPWKFGGNLADYCPYIDSTEMVGESSSTSCFNVGFHSDSATAGSYDRNFEEFLGNCIIQPNDLMNEGNADEGSDAAASQVIGRRKRWKLLFCVVTFRKRVALDVDNPLPKKQRVGEA